MNNLSCLAASCLTALCFVFLADAQESKAPPPSEEDQRLARIIENWLELNESEHDHVYREVVRGTNEKIDHDFGQWFTRLGGDDNGWDRTRIQRRSVMEIFDRMAGFLEVRGPILSREAFVTYAKSHWLPEKSTVWREPAPFDSLQESERLFRRFDLNRDNFLHSSEMPPALRMELNRWDSNEDGWIGLDEYRPYFARRLDRLYRESQQRSDKPYPPLQIRIVEDSETPAVPRAGKLPLGMPAWFEQVDTDMDAQIALHEWRAAGWPLDDFRRLDGNDDGFLEPQEMLKLLAVTDRAGARPFAFLLQLRPASVSSKMQSAQKGKR